MEAGIAGLLEPSCTQVIFLYTAPETAITHALAEGIAPPGFLDRWAAQHQALLGQLKRHRGRWVLLDASAAGLDPVSTVAAIGATPPEQAPGPVAPLPMALERLLTAGAVQAAPDVQRIAAHLMALSTPVNADQVAPSAPEDPISDYLDLQAEIRLQTDALQRSEREALQAHTRAEQARAEAEALAVAHQAQLDETTRAKTNAEALAHARQAEIEQLCAAKAAAEKVAAERQSQLDEAANASGMQRAEVAELKSENELLLLQLHQVQEELESWFLNGKAGEEELSSAKQVTQEAEALAHARQAEIEQLCAAKAAADKLAAECQSQLDQAAKALETQRAEVAELKSESELLLLQLHQVQEELESWFLKTKDYGEELQQAKQSGRAALEEAKARLDQARQNKDIAEKLARERYDVIRELRREKRRLETALALPVEEPRAEQAPAPQKPAIDPAKTPVSQSVMHEEQARAAAPSRATGLGGLFHRRRRIKGLKKKDVSVIRTSELFDADWYLETHTDVAEAGFDAAEHYLAFGYAEGRNPSPYFDGASYLALNPDVSAAGDNPLLHYLKFGKAEGRAINVSDAG